MMMWAAAGSQSHNIFYHLSPSLSLSPLFRTQDQTQKLGTVVSLAAAPCPVRLSSQLNALLRNSQSEERTSTLSLCLCIHSLSIFSLSFYPSLRLSFSQSFASSTFWTQLATQLHKNLIREEAWNTFDTFIHQKRHQKPETQKFQVTSRFKIHQLSHTHNSHLY